MKTRLRGSCRSGWLLAGVIALLSSAPPLAFAQLVQPVITSIRPDGTNVIVVATVPVGACRVTLEARARFGSGAWVPAAVAQVGPGAGTVTFRIACVRQSEMLRVRADATQPLPPSFYTGTNSFSGPVSDGTNPDPGLGPVAVFDDGNGTTAPTGDPGRAVVESDIWQFSGDTLFFFNQYRGLQVLDVSDPDHAAVLGALSLPAAGEQMYLPSSNRVVLLARGGCFSSGDSQAIVVAVSNGAPRVVTSLAIPGYLQESRMVGTALYVASQSYRVVPGTTNSTWEWGTLVSSFDLSDPDSPVARDKLWYPGYGNVVTATDTYLFVATEDPTNWWRSIVRIVDITSPSGSMAPYASLWAAGQIKDKFKINYSDSVLTTISEDWRQNTTTGVVTRLETFRLPDPRSAGPAGVTKLGELELGNRERLHASRFDGDRVYVVTFFQIDPLWVVDLADPEHPHIAGAVDVPGWSTYILPLGPRLVAVGVETNRVAVSLFDVASPANPRLLSRVRLGQNYSWSEANVDEKAFTVLPDIGLILVPYNGDTTNGWTTQVQLIDLNPTNLVARGIIRHQCQPRRATWSHDRILSLSGWELLSVDAADRDQPVVRGQTELAWPVDRLLVQGEYVLEISASTTWWGRSDTSAVRVAPAAQPDQVLSELLLDTLPVVGATVKDGRLYLAQGVSYPVLLPLDPAGGPIDKQTNFVLTVVDLTALPKLSVLGQVAAAVDLPMWSSGAWQPLWPQPGVLVWAGGGYTYWFSPWPGPITVGPGMAPPAANFYWPVASYGGGQFLAFDVSQPAAPKFASEVNLATNGWWGFSRSFAVGPRLYLSHFALDCSSPTNSPGTGIRRAYLEVIDYTDPLSPTLRAPANIPGTLQGVSRGDALLYTTGQHWDDHHVTDGKEWLDASSYNGREAFLVTSLALPASWPHPLLVHGESIFLGSPAVTDGTNSVPHQLETWTLADTAAFKLLGSVPLQAPATALIDRGALLAAQESGGVIALFDASIPQTLVPLAEESLPGCLWYDLSQSDGDLERGLWVPLGMYGVAYLPSRPR